jgi:hypothetical protein
MATSTSDARLRLIAENLARAALAEFKRDVKDTGTAASGASVGFGKMVFSQGNLIASTGNTRRAVNLFERGLQTLSFQAAGVPGGIGKASAAIGALGVGGGPILLATAALGIFALAWKTADEASELHANNIVAAADRMRRNITSAAHEVSAERQDVFAQRLAEARAQLATLQATPLPPQRFKQILGPEGSVSLKVGTPAEDRQVVVDALTNTIRQLGVALAGLTDKVNRSAEGLGLRQAQLERDIAAGRLRTIVPLLGGGVNREGAGFPFAKGMTLEKFGPREFFLSDLEKESGKALKKAGTPTGILIAQSFLSAVQLAQQGGPAGIFGAGGALLSGLSGIPELGSLGPIGIIASTFGSLISLFDRKDSERERNEERRHQELKGVLHEGFLRITFMNADGTAEAGLYEMRRAERLGGESRLGGL